MGRNAELREALDRLIMQLSPTVSKHIIERAALGALTRIALGAAFGDGNIAYQLLIEAAAMMKDATHKLAD